MSERDPALFAANNISDVFSAWLLREARASNGNGNSILDDVEKQRETVKDPANNIFNSKSKGHISRMHLWFEHIKNEKPGDFRDQWASRITFRGISLVASGYRSQRMLLAKDWDHNMDMKFLSKSVADPIGIYVPDVVNSFVAQHTHVEDETLKLVDSSIETLHDRAEAATKVAENKTNKIIQIAQSGVWGEYNPEANELAADIQTTWLDFATHAVLQSAGERGYDLTRVPMLEPKSENDNPSMTHIYPFGLTDPNNNTLIIPELTL